MNVFLTGATGYIGSAVAHELAKNNHRILALARNKESEEKLRKLRYKVIKGDLLQPHTWVSEAAQADAFIHCAQIRLGKRVGSSWAKDAALSDKIGFDGILRAARLNGRPKVIIYTSGISVVGDYGDQWTDESTPPKESNTVGSYHLKGEERASDASQEGLPVVILRPSLPVSSSGTFASYFLEQALMGKLKYVGSGRNYWPTVHIDDLARAYAQTVMNPPLGHTLIVSDDHPFTMEEFCNALMWTFGYRKAKSVPKWMVTMFGGNLLSNLLVSSFRVRNDKAKKLLDWKPLYPTFKESLMQVTSYYKTRRAYEDVRLDM